MSNSLFVPGVLLLLLAIGLLVVRLTARKDRSVWRFMTGASLISLGLGIYTLCSDQPGLLVQFGMAFALLIGAIGAMVMLYSVDTASQERGAMFSDDGKV